MIKKTVISLRAEADDGGDLRFSTSNTMKFLFAIISCQKQTQ